MKLSCLFGIHWSRRLERLDVPGPTTVFVFKDGKMQPLSNWEVCNDCEKRRPYYGKNYLLD